MRLTSNLGPNIIIAVSDLNHCRSSGSEHHRDRDKNHKSFPLTSPFFIHQSGLQSICKSTEPLSSFSFSSYRISNAIKCQPIQPHNPTIQRKDAVQDRAAYATTQKSAGPSKTAYNGDPILVSASTASLARSERGQKTA